MALKKRQDPKSVRADGYRAFNQIRNADPTRVYKWANERDEDNGLALLLAEGWELERKRPGGPECVVPGIKADDGLVRMKEYVLVSRPREEEQAWEAAKKATDDAIERKIKSRQGLEDPLAGRRSRYVSFENETSGLEGA